MIDGTPVELLCRDGRIAAIEPQPQGGTAGTGDGFTPTGVAVHDGGNRLLLPPLVESHIHLDKTLWGQAWRPNSGGPRLKDYISNERRILREIKEPVGSRAAALLEHCLALGSLKMRSHIDIDPEIGLHHAEALLELRERYRNLVDLDFVAFPQSGLLHAPGTAELMEQAIEMGVETIGGLDPAGIDHDPIGHLRLIFDLAAKHGCGIDIHLHDAGELGLWQIDRIADFTAASGLAGKVMVSHAYCLGAVPTAQIEVLGQRLAALDISLMTTAPSDTTLPPVDFLQQLGVNICCGSDNIRDAWAPFGTGDMLERALFLALRLDWSKDTEIAAAFDCVSQNGAHALGLDSQDRYGLAPGCPADFVLVDAETLGDAIARRPHARTIVRGGTVIAEDGSLIRSQR
ncbi:MAG TPA: amidohydrolase family protein [Dongiaceae bacterium]|nr:amidohydrolase family protein [Dongiaceae bacterium]